MDVGEIRLRDAELSVYNTVTSRSYGITAQTGILRYSCKGLFIRKVCVALKRVAVSTVPQVSIVPHTLPISLSYSKGFIYLHHTCKAGFFFLVPHGNVIQRCASYVNVLIPIAHV